ncbi:MAG: hypothetical protein ACPF8V_10380, partial [Luteibaculum sp.]
AMEEISNRIAVHLYRPEVDIDFVRNRLLGINKVGKKTKQTMRVQMLYSSEPPFMMHKLRETEVEEVHEEFMEAYRDRLNYDHVSIEGYIWFKASDLVGY